MNQQDEASIWIESIYKYGGSMDKVTHGIEDGIAQITTDDGKANAMNWGFFEEMGKSMDQAENDGTKALVITGRPGVAQRYI